MRALPFMLLLGLGNWPHCRHPPTTYYSVSSDADANARAKLFVGGFESCCDIDGIAVGGVVEQTAAAGIADHRRAGVYPDARHASGGFNGIMNARSTNATHSPVVEREEEADRGCASQFSTVST